MGNSGDESPDWLRSFKAPEQSLLTLSSDSDPSPSNSTENKDDAHLEEPDKHSKAKMPKQEKDQDTVQIDSGEDSPVDKAPKSKSTKAQVKQGSKSLKEENDGKGEAVKEDIPEKPVGPHTSPRMPLLMPEKVHRTKALVECEGDSIDMSGDVGAVGRLVVADTPSGDQEMLLDLKGTIYKTTIVPSRTFCIVNFGQAEAKIEAVMNDFIQLTPQSNVYEAETMIEGTLEGYTFESDEEADKIPKANAQGIETEEQPNGKLKGKADKILGVNSKKGKPVAKPPKRGKKKAQAPKKSKATKK